MQIHHKLFLIVSFCKSSDRGMRFLKQKLQKEQAVVGIRKRRRDKMIKFQYDTLTMVRNGKIASRFYLKAEQRDFMNFF